MFGLMESRKDWEHFHLDVGLGWFQGIFLRGKMSIAEMEAVIRTSPGWILVLIEALESFLLNLMVQEFRLLGEIPHDFCHFFVSDLIFAFRINCNISLTFSGFGFLLLELQTIQVSHNIILIPTVNKLLLLLIIYCLSVPECLCDPAGHQHHLPVLH